MTKRILSLILVCILAIPIMAMPAYATGFDDADSANLSSILTRVREISSTLSSLYWEVSENLYVLLYNWREQLQNQLATFESGMHQAFSALGSNINTYLEAQTESINAKLETVRATIVEYIGYLSGNIKTYINGLSDDIVGAVNGFADKATAHWTNLKNWIADLRFSIETKLDGVIQAILGTPGQLEDSENFEDDVQTETGEIQDMIDQMETVPMPDYEADGILANANGMWNEYGDANFLGLIQFLLVQEVFVLPIIFGIVFAFVGYLLYGKVR